MTAKISPRSILAFLALLSAISLGVASVASADQSTPPPLPEIAEIGELPGEGEVPPVQPPKQVVNPTKTPESHAEVIPAPESPRPESREAKILKARIARGRLAVLVGCSSPGTVRLSGGVTQPFSCVSGKGSASLTLSGKQRQGMTRGRSLHVSVIVNSGGSVTRAPLTIQRRSVARGRTMARVSSVGYWNEVHSSCAAYSRSGGGAYMRVDTTSSNGFGVAAPHETVYWRALVAEYRGGRWLWAAHPWESYGVTSMADGYAGDGYMVIGGGGLESVLGQAFNIPSGVWTIPAVQIWTQRAGYHWAWVGPTMEGFGTRTSGPYCYAD